MLIIKAAITLRQRERALFVLHRRAKIPHFRLGRGQSIENHGTAMLETLTGPARILHSTLAIAHAAVRASGQQPRVVVVGEKIIFIERDCFLQIYSRSVIGTIQRLGGGAIDVAILNVRFDLISGGMPAHDHNR